MYAINWINVFWDSAIQWELSVSTWVNNVWVQVEASGVSVNNADLTISNLSWGGERPLAVDSNGTIIEATAAPGGVNFSISDDFAQTNTIVDSTNLSIVGSPYTPVKTYFSSPTTLEVRLEWGSPGQVVGYDWDLGAGWVNGILTYSDIIIPIGGSPLVIPHNWWTTKVQVSVYDTATGEQVTPTTVSRDSNDVRVTMPVSNEIEIVIIWFI